MKSQNLKLIFAGDLLPADRVNTLGVGSGSHIDCKCPIWSKELTNLFCKTDINIVNLEAPIIEEIESISRVSFAGRVQILDYLELCNITHVHIANNHIMEHGVESFYRTLALLKRRGIEPLGEQGVNGYKIVQFEVKGYLIAMAAFNAVHDLPNLGCYAELSEKALVDCLQETPMYNADLRILSFHWGNEYIHIPSWDQIQMARKAVDMGAHLVVGHHPHVIQPVEEYKGGVICYSLGNFLFDMLWNNDVKTGAVLEVKANRHGVDSWHIHACRYNKSCFVSMLSMAWLEPRMKQWVELMKNMEAKGEDYYRKKYDKQVKIKRLFARISMKKQLIRQLTVMSKTQKMMFMTSLIRELKQ